MVLAVVLGFCLGLSGILVGSLVLGFTLINGGDVDIGAKLSDTGGKE